MKLGLILASNASLPQPSTRIAVLNMLPFLRAGGWQCDIVFQPAPLADSECPDLSALSLEALRSYDVILFQKVAGPSAVALAQQLGAAGVRTIYCVCDRIGTEMAAACDRTVVISSFLRSLYPEHLQPRIEVVCDGLEDTSVVCEGTRQRRGGVLLPLRAVLVTSSALSSLPQIGLPPPWLAVDVVGRYPDSTQRLERLKQAVRLVLNCRGWRARLRAAAFLCHPRVRRLRWSPATVALALQRADFAILPIDTAAGNGRGIPDWQLKSANRLTLKMGAGLAVLSTPIPAYEEVLEHGINGLFARDAQEWRQGLQQLRDPALRRRLGAAGRERALRDFAPDVQARALLRVLNGLAVPSVAHSAQSEARV
jgi:hypothetical protein